MATEKRRVLVLLAQGAEEMEAIIVVDLLRRAGIEVLLTGIDGSGEVLCSRGVRILPDRGLAEVEGPFDLVVLPGGLEGSERLAANSEVGNILRRQEESGGAIAAICAAPLALVAHRVGSGLALTSHPAVREVVAAHGEYHEQSVVEDGPLVTSRGPGTAFEFALTLIRRLLGDAKAEEVRTPLML